MTFAELAALVLAGVAVVGAITGYLTSRNSRLRDAEARIDKLEDENNDLWLWARALVDHIYRRQPPESMPRPPERKKQ